MAYRFERNSATIQDSIREIGVELIDNAIACASGKMRDVDEAIHSFRKSCKKLRGLIRLVRPVFDGYVRLLPEPANRLTRRWHSHYAWRAATPRAAALAA